MESEKVKEIKNNIIICSTKIECKGCSLFPNMKSTNCRNKLLADALTLINCENKGKTIYKSANGDEYDTFLSLNDCLKEIGYRNGVCIVIFKTALSGQIYQYGNYGDGFWYEHGKTKGYA